jgi:hypothetical protein
MSIAVQISTGSTSCAQWFVGQSFRAGIAAQGLVFSVESERMAKSRLRNTANACLRVGGSSPPALISVPHRVMTMAKAVHHAKNPVTFAAPTPNAARCVASPVRPAQMLAHGPAFTAENARCPVRCPAIYYHVPSDVRKVSTADTNVRQSAGKRARQRSFARLALLLKSRTQMLTTSWA